ncbi:acetate--CoA ligase family protein [Thermomonas carbonis]|uniref:Acetate--CoA ligase family protein n=1 Tax=Thermomonas carbonis TaxID=1463158 RepID=A0A7G9SNY8_9GAMM|nr:acetate--CoA ligase family protein [Thermomonas carbonis]QNN69563.1 acetate--CoA ligase family protein [Thermomonas carbonis]GHB93919.1 hypothetical protein GCM10010080_01220 [Thermomonas carbonis]
MISLAQWKVTPGAGFGFFQPVLTAVVQADGVPETLPAWQQEALATLCHRLDIDALPPIPADAVFDAGRWVAAISHGLQRNARLAVFQSARLAIPTPAATGLRPGGALIAPYANHRATIDSLQYAASVVSSILQARNAGDAETAIQRAVADAEPLRMQLGASGDAGVNTYRILAAAAKARIPCLHLVGGTYLVGQGHRSRWLLSTFTDRTSRIGSQIAGNKAATSTLLAANGLPVARHLHASSVIEAVKAAETLGYPVVVKPLDRENGVGVHAGLTTAEQVERLAAEALVHSNALLVERFQAGRDYRLTVMGGETIKMIERVPGSVVGNGRDDISALVAQAGRDDAAKRRSRERRRERLALDGEALELLALANLDAGSVLADGERIVLRRRSNVSTGGTTRLVERLHPDNRRLAEDAARALRLDVAGVDLILPDIERSWRETGGIICEVNSQPQLGEQDTPGLYQLFLTRLLGGNGRIPATLVISSYPDAGRDPESVRRFGPDAGTAIVYGGTLTVAGAIHATFGDNLFSAVRAALMSERVHALVVLASPQRLLQSGLPLDLFDNVQVYSIAADNASEPAEEEARRLYRMLRPHAPGRWEFHGDGRFGRALASHVQMDANTGRAGAP